MRFQVKAAAVLFTLLSGCASVPPASEVTDEVYANRLIAEKIAIAANAQRDHAALLAEGQSRVERKQEMLLTDLIDVDYIGMPQELIQTIAYRYGYRYVEVGKRSQLRAININVQHVSPSDVLRTVGQQIDYGADVVLSLPSRTVRLIYKDRISAKRR